MQNLLVWTCWLVALTRALQHAAQENKKKEQEMPVT
jgi:hypothetical protein